MHSIHTYSLEFLVMFINSFFWTVRSRDCPFFRQKVRAAKNPPNPNKNITSINSRRSENLQSKLHLNTTSSTVRYRWLQISLLLGEWSVIPDWFSKCGSASPNSLQHLRAGVEVGDCSCSAAARPQRGRHPAVCMLQWCTTWPTHHSPASKQMCSH